MAIFFSSDMHYGHKNIIKLCNRPFKDLDEMHKELKDRWNSKIMTNDTTYIVGDFSFMQESSTRRLLGALNGTKILIRGNHDKDKNVPKDCYQEIVEQKQIMIGNRPTLLCHYPYKGTPEELQHAKENNYTIKHMEKRPEDKGHWLVHGHLHDKGWKIKRHMINVSVEQWNYYPVSEKEIIEVMDGN